MSLKGTITQAALEGASEREVAEQMRQLRKAANFVYTTTRKLATTKTGVDTVIWQSEDPMPASTSIVLQVKVQGASADGAQYATMEEVAMFQRLDTGAATQRGAMVDKMVPLRSAAALTVTLGVDANSRIFVKVNDGNLGAMAWKLWIEARSQ